MGAFFKFALFHRIDELMCQHENNQNWLKFSNALLFNSTNEHITNLAYEIPSVSSIRKLYLLYVHFVSHITLPYPIVNVNWKSYKLFGWCLGSIARIERRSQWHIHMCHTSPTKFIAFVFSICSKCSFK